MKEEQLAKFMADADKYIFEKKNELREARKEIVGLFDLVKRQRLTIEDVENGKYDGGIRSYHIPKEDKQANPTRETHPFLYKSLEKSKSLVTTNLTSKVFQVYEQRQSSIRNLTVRPSATVDSSRPAAGVPKFTTKPATAKTANQTFDPQYHHEPSESKFENQSVASFSEYSTVKPSKIDRMALDDLKRYAKALQSEITRCKTTTPLNPAGVREEKLKALLADREKWKQKAAMDKKRVAEALESLESTKRVSEQFNLGSQKGVGFQTASQSQKALTKPLSKNTTIKSAALISQSSGLKRPPSATASHAVLSNHRI